MRSATPDEFITNGLATTHIPTGVRFSTYRYSDPLDAVVTHRSVGQHRGQADEYDPDQVQEVATEILREAVRNA